MPQEVYIVFVCDMLGLSFTELMQQPAQWVEAYLLYLEGKAKAEKAKLKQGKK